jgi:hypothetical protein
MSGLLERGLFVRQQCGARGLDQACTTRCNTEGQPEPKHVEGCCKSMHHISVSTVTAGNVRRALDREERMSKFLQ